MPHPKFEIHQLVAVPEDICTTHMGSIMSIEYQPPTHVSDMHTDAELRRDNIDCSGYVYRLSLHGGVLKFVDEKTLLSWNRSRIEKLQTPAPSLDILS